MDVIALAARLPEPAVTARLRAFLDDARSRLAEDQRAATEGWARTGPFEDVVLHRFRQGHFDPTELAHQSKRIADDDHAKDLGERSGLVAQLLGHAVAKPAVTSALVWECIGARDPALASHVVQFVRERAGLPGLRRRITAGEPQSLGSDHGPHLGWFADRQCEDMASWIEAVPAPTCNTLDAARTALRAQRDHARRIPRTELAAFLPQAARFISALSTQRLDPLGFPFGKDAQLVVDPALELRLEVAAWARQVGHQICVPGELVIARLPVTAPWPLHLELIAAELGRGACGGGGLLLRLCGARAIESPTRAPVMLCLPDEALEERGARFERWMSIAYPHAVDTWRPWC